MTREPVALSTLITAAVAAVLAALVGLDIITLTPDQTALLVGAVTAVVALAGGIWARAKVTPVGAPSTAEGEPAVLVPKAELRAGRHFRVED